MQISELEAPVRLEVHKMTSLDKNIWQRNVRLLEEYCGKAIAEIEREYNDAITGIEFEMQKKIHREPDPALIRKYYETCNTYLFELSACDSLREQQREYHKVARFFSQHKINKIMDFGGGVGGFCVFMKERGLDTTYFDVVGNTSRYAERKFKKLGLAITAVYDFNALEDESFDAIHTADCLEHVPHLMELFGKLTPKLKKDGYFILKATFSGGGIHLRENEKYRDIAFFIDQLAERKLRFLGQLKDDRLSFNINKIIPNYGMLAVYIQYRKKHSGNYLVFRKQA